MIIRTEEIKHSLRPIHIVQIRLFGFSVYQREVTGGFRTVRVLGLLVYQADPVVITPAPAL